MYSEILILAMLGQGPRHGYEIRKDVERALGGTIALNTKTLYLALKRFEEMGAVTRQVVLQEGKPNRHLYELTERGKELLHASLREFPAAQAASEAEFFTRVAFFDLLEVTERREILATRLAYLEGCLAYLRDMQQLADTGEACADVLPSLSNAQRVLAFHTQRLHNEARWIGAFLDELPEHS